MEVVVALGANLGDRHATFRRAVEELGSRVGPVRAVSRWRETAPLTLPDAPADEVQSPYLNGCALIDTALSVSEVLTSLLEIEKSLGRDREKEPRRWMSRIIDLDLIAAEQSVVDAPQLKVPHPQMQHRRFVLEPFIEVAPNWRHPVLGLTANEMLARLHD